MSTSAEPLSRRGLGRLSSISNTYSRQILLFAGFVGLVVALLVTPTIPNSSSKSTTSTSPVPSGITPATTPQAPGLTVAGIRCGPGVRQLPWSHYSPWCQPAWHGNNGGATAPGVTATTITLTYRLASSSELSLLYALIPKWAIGTNQETIRTLNAYIKVFNHYFELYGRHVVLKPFMGQGNFINEDVGKGAPQAQADAVTAKSMGAFADMSLIDSSLLYNDDLVAQHVIAFSLYTETASWFAKRAPYVYTPGPDLSKAAVAAAAIVGKEMSGLPAIYAGKALTHKKRVIGILYMENNPQVIAAKDLVVSDLSHYGVHPAIQVGYSFDLSTLESQAQSAIAQFKSAGVTTVLYIGTDPVTPIFLTKAADEQNYYPEWYIQPGFAITTGLSPLVQLLPTSQTAHLFAEGLPLRSDQEAVQTWRMAHVSGKIEPLYPLIYSSLLQFFDGLQAAGPYLTPQSFSEGLARLPHSTPGGMFGSWSFSAGTIDPVSDFHIEKYDPSIISQADGRPGAFIACNGGRGYSYANGAKNLPAHTQPYCPVKP